MAWLMIWQCSWSDEGLTGGCSRGFARSPRRLAPAGLNSETTPAPAGQPFILPLPLIPTTLETRVEGISVAIRTLGEPLRGFFVPSQSSTLSHETTAPALRDGSSRHRARHRAPHDRLLGPRASLNGGRSIKHLRAHARQGAALPEPHAPGARRQSANRTSAAETRQDRRSQGDQPCPGN